MDPGSEKAAMEFIEKFYEGESTGHDYWHSIRVYNMAMAICDTEPEADRDIVGMAALLHDLDDRKLGGDEENLPVASGFLKTHGATQSETKRIIEIIHQISFKGEDSVVPACIEGKIVQDADRLDAIGAIGIARTFAYGGAHKRPIWNPNNRPKDKMSAEEYYGSRSDSIAHFYEKLLKLRSMMNTDEGKRVAQRRHDCMLIYLDEFMDEWNGKR